MKQIKVSHNDNVVTCLPGYFTGTVLFHLNLLNRNLVLLISVQSSLYPVDDSVLRIKISHFLNGS